VAAGRFAADLGAFGGGALDVAAGDAGASGLWPNHGHAIRPASGRLARAFR